ncbi:MAG: hypothetical protein BWY66_01982 [bacterium ADurb.Bin374]|nr:MAG: hypothetical protein BWY66_01982 [bacterium ADurb.Bin374]
MHVSEQRTGILVVRLQGEQTGETFFGLIIPLKLNLDKREFPPKGRNVGMGVGQPLKVVQGEGKPVVGNAPLGLPVSRILFRSIFRGRCTRRFLPFRGFSFGGRLFHPIARARGNVTRCRPVCPVDEAADVAGASRLRERVEKHLSPLGDHGFEPEHGAEADSFEIRPFDQLRPGKFGQDAVVDLAGLDGLAEPCRGLGDAGENVVRAGGRRVGFDDLLILEDLGGEGLALFAGKRRKRDDIGDIDRLPG